MPRKKSNAISRRQQQILEFIVTESETCGYPPVSYTHLVQRRIDESLIPEEEWSRRNLKHDPAEVIADAKQVLILVGSHEPFKEPFPPGIAEMCIRDSKKTMSHKKDSQSFSNRHQSISPFRNMAHISGRTHCRRFAEADVPCICPCEGL